MTFLKKNPRTQMHEENEQKDVKYEQYFILICLHSSSSLPHPATCVLCVHV
jgi:hypothetical protein